MVADKAVKRLRDGLRDAISQRGHSQNLRSQDADPLQISGDYATEVAYRAVKPCEERDREAVFT